MSITDTDYGQVLLDEQHGEYFQLNPTGALVASGLLAHHTPHQIAAELAREYEVTVEQAEADVTALIEALRREGLIVP
ncbi:lasso peptide biosynthesis PqqD family chaperone [Prauserella rugosa]|uniref:lasso peptide biosynthesis PqqD family chaperone n=1 Tax=Prauserella rugosa TaxID=43354 RepID=UPI00068E13FB|nr:lasso peptide biosynthesis PqqD family chaperone [Prauserella rugosa]